MNNPFSKLLNSVKQVRFARIAISVVAAFVLFLGTACSPSSSSASNMGASQGGVSGTGSYQHGRKTQTELYRPNQPNEGGMNSYSDTDPRYNTKGLGADIKARVDEAERNVQKVQNPKEFTEDYREGTPLGERVRNITDSVGGAAKDVTEDFAEGTQRGVRNLKANASNAGEDARDTVDQARENAVDFGKDTSRAAKRTANELSNNVDNARQDIKANARDLRSDRT